MLRQGDAPGKIYIVFQGKCKVLRNIALKYYDYPHLEEMVDLIQDPKTF